MKDTPAIDAVEAFLDAADEVLNSNTFLVELALPAGGPLAAVEEFIHSGRLQEAIFAADIARGWYNLHRFTPGGGLEPLQGNFSVPHCRVTSRAGRCDAAEYLQAMLRGDPRAGDFVSFYRCGKSPWEARRLARRLLHRLFPHVMPNLYLFEADFLQGDGAPGSEAYYFEGKGCDNAALLAGQTEGYLLLTNGAP